MPTGIIQHLNTQSTELTNNSVLVASAVYGEWREPQQSLLNSFFYPLYDCLLVSLNVAVLVVVVVVGCV